MMLLLLSVLLKVHEVASQFNSFDDSIFFDVVWGDPKTDLNPDKETIVLKTKDSEEYSCQLPVAPEHAYTLKTALDAPTARSIVSKLETGEVCSYRVDSYWIYEICHGKHIKQFHEQRDVNNKKVIVQQSFMLGYFSYDSLPTSEARSTAQVDTINHAGALRPYYSITYTGGTECDLKEGLKRKTTVKYICMPDFQTTVTSVKEILSCEYEIIVYTALLCENPLYRIQEDPINHIMCLSKDGTRKRPVGFNALSLNKQDTLFGSPQLNMAIPQGDTDHPKSQKNPITAEPRKSQLTFPEKEFIKQFLSGSHCVVGGTGWWKYEFCYMKSVKQFHLEKNGKREDVILGIWDKDMHNAHLATLSSPNKGPTYTDLFFFNGNICDQTGLPRRVTVRLRCATKGNVQAIVMFLEEPAMCDYRFTVESVMLCQVVEGVDKYGVPEIDLDEMLSKL